MIKNLLFAICVWLVLIFTASYFCSTFELDKHSYMVGIDIGIVVAQIIFMFIVNWGD